MESYVVLQEKLDTHRQRFNAADASIKRMNGRADDNNRVVTNERRKVSIPDERPPKRKSYDEKHSRSFPDSKNNKRNSGLNKMEISDEKEPSIRSSVVSSTVIPIKSKEDLIKLQNKGNNVQRNKRIFGHLLGTLTQFKTDDKVRSSTTQAIHRKELEAKIEVQKVEDTKKQIENKLKLEMEKIREQQNVEILEEKIKLAKAFEEWKTNQMQYRKFIRTKSKPFVFYLPKEMDEDTQKLLDASCSFIDGEIAKRLKETEAELDVLTKKSARLNNEMEEVEDKENNKDVQMESGSEDGEMMDDKDDGVNVELGDEDEEEGPASAKSEKIVTDDKCEVDEQTVPEIVEEEVEQVDQTSEEMTDKV